MFSIFTARSQDTIANPHSVSRGAQAQRRRQTNESASAAAGRVARSAVAGLNALHAQSLPGGHRCLQTIPA